MRVAIDGPQSTGKTTLLEALRPTLAERWRVVEEASRHVAPRFGITAAADWPALLADQDNLRAFFDAEIEWLLAQETEYCLVDSSAFLVLAYKDVFLESVETIPAWLAGRYDTVLVCSSSQGPSEDGFRFLDGREAVAASLRRLHAQDPSVHVVVLPEGEARLQAAKGVLSRHLAAERM